MCFWGSCFDLHSEIYHEITVVSSAELLGIFAMSRLMLFTLKAMSLVGRKAKKLLQNKAFMTLIRIYITEAETIHILRDSSLFFLRQFK